MPARTTSPVRVTSEDVARRAGVSRSTVSLVLSGKADGRVSEQVAQRVIRLAGEMGYQPNAAAHTLRLGRSRTIAVVAFAPGNDPNRLPSGTALFGAESAARERGYAVVAYPAHSNEPWDRLVDFLNSSRVDGAIFTSLPGIMPQLERFAGRCVLLGPRIGPVPAVDVDHIGACRLAMDHLFALGHQQIGYLWPGLDGGRRRHGTWRHEMTRRGIDPDGNLSALCRWDVEDARQAALRLLRTNPACTAVICADEVMLTGLYRAARLLGRTIPDDLSVITFVDSRLPLLLDPAPTTIAMPVFDAGRRAMGLLLDVLDGRPVPDQVEIPASLVDRGSTGPAVIPGT